MQKKKVELPTQRIPSFLLSFLSSVFDFRFQKQNGKENQIFFFLSFSMFSLPIIADKYFYVLFSTFLILFVFTFILFNLCYRLILSLNPFLLYHFLFTFRYFSHQSFSFFLLFFKLFSTLFILIFTILVSFPLVFFIIIVVVISPFFFLYKIFSFFFLIPHYFSLVCSPSFLSLFFFLLCISLLLYPLPAENYKGWFIGHGVLIYDDKSARELYQHGCFGKGLFSRSESTFIVPSCSYSAGFLAP